MTAQIFRPRATRGLLPAPGTITICLCALLVISALCATAIKARSELQATAFEQVIAEKSAKLYEVISSLLYKTHGLAALVVQNDGRVREFNRIASYLNDDPAILNILLAPEGVVEYIQPLYGNEEAFGFNLFGDAAGNLEAVQAKDKGQLVFGGPFELVQGGRALVGRLPIYIGRPGQGRVFWGLASVTLKFPEALNGVELDSLARQGLGYEIWRINPDDGKRQVIASSADHLPGDHYLERQVKIFNADWYFRIIPVIPWYKQPLNLLLLGGGLLIWALFCMVFRNNLKLKSLHEAMRSLLMTDSLTGVLNRRGLFEQMEKLIAARKPFRLYYMDLNYFKQINDTYGHEVGDLVLLEFCARIGKHLTADHIFGRLGGDEFILLRLTGPGRAPRSERFREIMRMEFEAPVVTGGVEFMISFSTGLAVFPDDASRADKLVSMADRRMYASKNAKYGHEFRRRSTDWETTGPADSAVSHAESRHF